MKKLKKILLIAVLCLLCVAQLSACSKAPAMRLENGVYTNPKTGISYLPAPFYYEAVDIMENREVARLKQGDLEDLSIYEINGVDPAKMLASRSYEVFYAVGTEMPELWEMQLTRVLVTKTASISYAEEIVTDVKDLAALSELYRSGVWFDGGEIESALERERYDLKFEGSACPGVRYVLTYWQFEEDVLIYEDIDDPSSFTPSYAGVEYTLEEYGDGTYYAAYNFGKYILYNRVTERAYAVGEVIYKYLAEEGATQAAK